MRVLNEKNGMNRNDFEKKKSDGVSAGTVSELFY